ncbi:hypothetical protein [Opitutus sp. ER46]|uniref:hypothetical protein n=1 Tax=Opitutus sp. ER46 TaxID=2161864 RepID=UPI0011B25E21|nr:hypothetical protein [Opitutus sp. ER46]
MKLVTSILLLAAFAAHAFGADTPSDRFVGYRARVREVLDWRAAQVKPDDPKTAGLPGIAAKLARHEDAAWCSAQVVELMKAPSGDMFWMFPCVSIAYLGRDQLTPEAKAAMRRAWREYMPLRGDTENHWAMYYTSLYLMAELWPNEPGETWFSGKSSAENLAEAKAYLISWMDLATTVGQGEYDCTHYLGEYCIPMLYLATWAKDPEMRQRGRMMLDWILADYAIDTLNGAYVGAHARTDDRQVLEKWNGLSSFFGWLFLDNCPAPAGYGGWGIFFAAAASASDYTLPEVIYRLGTDRAGPYLSREHKRTRHRWRNSDVRNAPVYKQTYVTRDYAVGSDQGGMLQPIQQHSWDVTWAVADPRGVHNTMFSMHPHVSIDEMQMYFTEFPDWMPTLVTLQNKPSYDKEDKLLGGSEFEQVCQDHDTIVALYDIRPGTKYEQVNGFFSKDLVRLEEDASGWIFAQGGNAYLAYRPLAPYEWRPIAAGGKRLVSPHRRNGTILQVAAAHEFASWDAFKAAIRALPLTVALEPKPKVTFKTLRGHTMVCAYGETPQIDGKPVDFAKWPLFESPYLHADVGSRKLRMTHGRLEHVVDFNTLTVTDRVTQP